MNNIQVCNVAGYNGALLLMFRHANVTSNSKFQVLSDVSSGLLSFRIVICNVVS